MSNHRIAPLCQVLFRHLAPGITNVGHTASGQDSSESLSDKSPSKIIDILDLGLSFYCIFLFFLFCVFFVSLYILLLDYLNYFSILLRFLYWVFGVSLVAQIVKNLPAMWDTWVWFLGREDPLEKGMAIQYSCLENSMDRGAWWATVHGITKNQT